ncbi:Hypothetical Protein FCC1311_101912 [Hondaea fermentalgiana]|uniref:Uncharacterized protein n=1 Tax=Hondaea fermentalgiana TaxID=2315210 RepID=A0A2R5GW26_9STRA|nr:Hypothetical Protein FCC1311_101912 [Hondaea fermentalgiana]|eukprot:GBG33968.1 Hypothetical Protein FCC1311_101912 [Hondaea fermentalgiana]
MPRAVRFSRQPEVRNLPEEEARDAWLARVGPWTSAPKHDEIWDGDMRQFRVQELTPAELRRLRFDDKLRRAMPSSVFMVYKRYRKKGALDSLDFEDIAPPSGQHPGLRRQDPRDRDKGSEDDGDEGLSDDEDTSNIGARRRPIHSQTVPREFIQGVLEDSIQECLSAGIKPVLKKKTKSAMGLTTSLRRSISRRNSKKGAQGGGVGLPDEFPEPPGYRKPSLLDYFLPFRTGDDDLGSMLPWLESIQRLDGLENTSVPRSDAVEDVWDRLEDAFSQLKLLGSSILWDFEAFRQSIWPTHDDDDDAHDERVSPLDGGDSQDDFDEDDDFDDARGRR